MWNDGQYDYTDEGEIGTAVEGGPNPGEQPAFDKDGKTIVRAVKLKPNTTYVVWLNTQQFDNFKDTFDRPAVPYLWVFRTGPGKGK